MLDIYVKPLLIEWVFIHACFNIISGGNYE
jgi:hypothetical protein